MRQQQQQLLWRHDSQQNDIQHNNTHTKRDTNHKRHSILSVVTLCVCGTKTQNAECFYAECFHAECRYTECHCAIFVTVLPHFFQQKFFSSQSGPNSTKHFSP
jgi:hypothetical protein